MIYKIIGVILMLPLFGCFLFALWKQVKSDESFSLFMATNTVAVIFLALFGIGFHLVFFS